MHDAATVDALAMGLAGVLVGLLAAGLVPVSAGNGDPVLVGQFHSGQNATVFRSPGARTVKVVSLRASGTCSSAAIRTLDATGIVGAYSSMAAGPDGFPIIAHWLNAAADLKVADCGDLACQEAVLTTPDFETDTGLYTSMMVLPDGFPVVAYYDFTDGALQLLRLG